MVTKKVSTNPTKKGVQRSRRSSCDPITLGKKATTMQEKTGLSRDSASRRSSAHVKASTIGDRPPTRGRRRLSIKEDKELPTRVVERTRSRSLEVFARDRATSNDAIVVDKSPSTASRGRIKPATVNANLKSTTSLGSVSAAEDAPSTRGVERTRSRSLEVFTRERATSNDSIVVCKRPSWRVSWGRIRSTKAATEYANLKSPAGSNEEMVAPPTTGVERTRSRSLEPFIWDKRHDSDDNNNNGNKNNNKAARPRREQVRFCLANDEPLTPTRGVQRTRSSSLEPSSRLIRERTQDKSTSGERSKRDSRDKKAIQRRSSIRKKDTLDVSQEVNKTSSHSSEQSPRRHLSERSRRHSTRRHSTERSRLCLELEPNKTSSLPGDDDDEICQSATATTTTDPFLQLLVQTN
jgi:hypothetical protein